MKIFVNTLALILISITMLNYNVANQETFKPKLVYKTNDLIVTQIAKNSFVHTSFKQTNDFVDMQEKEFKHYFHKYPTSSKLETIMLKLLKVLKQNRRVYSNKLSKFSKNNSINIGFYVSIN